MTDVHSLDARKQNDNTVGDYHDSSNRHSILYMLIFHFRLSRLVNDAYRYVTVSETVSESIAEALLWAPFLAQNTQADLTHHLFNVHHFHRSSAFSTCPNQYITCNVTSRRTSCSNSRGRDSSRTEAVL